MKKIMAVLSLLIVAMMSLVSLYASETPVFIRGIRPLGMGGAFVAVADDQNAVFYNPAGLTQREGSQFTMFELPMNISEDVLKFYSFYNDNKDKLKNFDQLSDNDKIDLLNQINDKITTYKPNLRLGLPNTSYLSGHGFLSWGFGIYNQEDIGFQFNRSLIVPSVSVWGNADAVAALPLAHRFDKLPYIPGMFSIGTTVKYIERGRISELNKSVLELENFSPDLQLGHGLGFDLGALYQPTERWNIGLQVSDIGGTNLAFAEVTSDKAGMETKPAFTSMIAPQTNIGLAYIPSRIYYWPGKYIGTQDRLILACDVRDITNSDTSLLDATFFPKLHMGAELRWGPLSLRGGYSSGYPAFGAGFRIPYLGLKIDYAYWGDETGLYAGQMPVWNHQITLALSWGDAQGRVYGKNATVKEEKLALKKNEKTIAVDIKKSADGAFKQNDAVKAAGTGTPDATLTAPQTVPAAVPAATPAAPAGVPATDLAAPAADAPVTAVAPTPAAQSVTPAVLDTKPAAAAVPDKK
jgi:hypothetical protein